MSDAPDRAEITRYFEDANYDLYEHPAHIIRRAHQHATNCFQGLFADYDTTPTQIAALATLLKHTSLSQNQLGRLTAMDPSTISIVVRKLVKEGYVKGAPSPSDNRLSMLSLTPRGVEFITPLLKLSVEAGALFLSRLNNREQATFIKLLKKVVPDAM